jgi:(1->4)-alpha-D-glucan 1-alpha-D-glucosylmutase
VFPGLPNYVEPGRPVAEEDRQIVERAIAGAKRRNPAMEGIDLQFFARRPACFVPRRISMLRARRPCAVRSKVSAGDGPIMAKGLEDTLFYIYNRLPALNEVGGEPQQFGLGADAFHERNLDRQRDWPATLLATSTHDTKRSEDVRARIVAISEIPELWRRSLQRWSTANHRWKRMVNDLEAPDANEEYLLYQILLGTWPTQANGEPEPLPAPDYIERIRTYMTKALKEAKINTSWIQPNEAWDAAMHDFIARILESSTRNKFLPAFLPAAKEIIRLGAINSLTQTLLKLTSPGVPDIYQGTEIWDYSLVDPDNRRPVDYELRRQLLKSLSSASPGELMQTWPDGRIKMFLTKHILRFRSEHADLFESGEHLPLQTRGTFAESCVSFVRRRGENWIAVIAPRLSSRVGFPPTGEVWQDTAIQLPESFSLKDAHDLFTCRPTRHQKRQVVLRDVLSVLAVRGGYEFALSVRRGGALQDSLTLIVGRLCQTPVFTRNCEISSIINCTKLPRLVSKISAETFKRDLSGRENQHDAEQQEIHQIDDDERKKCALIGKISLILGDHPAGEREMKRPRDPNHGVKQPSIRCMFRKRLSAP